MSEGLWTATQSAEKVQQSQFIRHRLLVVSPGTNAAAAWPANCASGYASADPNTIAPGTQNAVTPRGNEGGPHFIMSGQTPDESHTYGFEFMLFGSNLDFGATAGAGGFTVTIWVLITNTQDPISQNVPYWAAMAPQTGLQYNELWHTFDVNAEAIRFQIENFVADPAVTNEAIGIAFSEL